MEGTDSPNYGPVDGEATRSQHEPVSNGYPSAAADSYQRPGLIPKEYLGVMPRLRRREDQDLVGAYEAKATPLAVKYAELVSQRTYFSHNLEKVRASIDTLGRQMSEDDRRFVHEQERLAIERQNEDAPYQGRAWADSPRNRNHDLNATYPTMPASNGTLRLPGSVSNGVLASSEGQFSANPANRSVTASGSATGAFVVNHRGQTIGPISRPMVVNLRTTEILKLPIQGNVYIRQGHTINDQQLAATHDPNDNKASKWLGLMIQATGEHQQQECMTCREHGGPFSQCIIVSGDLFPRCGNCEWGHSICNGAISADTEAPRAQSGFTAVNMALNNSASADDFAASTSVFPSQSKARRSLPNGRGGKRTQPTAMTAAESVDSGGDAVADTATDAQHDDGVKSPTPTSVSGQEPEITRESLQLCHDGTVFLEPQVMEGVPVDKIDPSHPYWEPEWRMIEDIITPKLKDWQTKLDEEVTNAKDKSAKFLANRQVNRGKAVLEYLENGDMHPYQLVRKELIQHGYTNYDTIYRLIGTLQELKKFPLPNISPIEWMRQRVQEVYEKDPEKFRLEIMVKNMYHDSKLTDLRIKNGYGNIGRPSGLKAKSRKLPPAGKSDPEVGEKIGEKRKVNPGSARASPKKRPRTAVHSDDGGDDQENGGNELQSGLALTAERLRSLDATASTQIEDDALSAFTAADSYCGAETKKWDWRLAQVKTSENVSSDGITQYWNFKPECEFGQSGKLEHQVLREINPAVSWGVYKHPMDYHVFLDQIKKIEFCEESLMVAVRVTKDFNNHGDVLARFKRPRTMKRWLKFVRERKIDLEELTRDDMDEVWDDMDPPVHPTDPE